MANDFSTGLNTSFEFGATVYTVVQNAAFQRVVDDVTAIIAGIKKGYPGPASYTFRISLAIKKTDHAVMNALAEGDTGAAALYIGGNTTGNIKMSTTEAVIMESSGNITPASYVPLDLTVRFNDLTTAAAA